LYIWSLFSGDDVGGFDDGRRRGWRRKRMGKRGCFGRKDGI
jgi:hypothetical protein